MRSPERAGVCVEESEEGLGCVVARAERKDEVGSGGLKMVIASEPRGLGQDVWRGVWV